VAAIAGFVTWLGVTLIGVQHSPPGSVIVFIALGIYLVGPLWIAVRYRVDEKGVERRTMFGAKTWAWDDLARYLLVPKERTGYLYPKGRGSARFLPPVLLLWEEGASVGEPLAAWLSARLEGKVA
jgi:hypothetical protein